MNDDKQAENCIVQACEELTDLGIPLNSITVPDKATAILYKKLKSETEFNVVHLEPLE
jgi:hypothetical protein